jgi:WD40 repeat protein
MTTPDEPQPPTESMQPARRWQFTLGGLFMFITLVAILLTFLKAEGCSKTYTKIGSLQFSADGKRLAAARYIGHDAHTPLKRYMADLSRTISIINTESHTLERVVEHATKPGNQGTAFRSYSYVGNCVAFAPNGTALFVADYDAKGVTRYDLTSGKGKHVIASANEDVLSLVLSHDGTVAAIGCSQGVELWDIQSGKQIRQIVTFGMAFAHAPAVAMSLDGRTIVTAGDSGVCLWNTKDGSLRQGHTPLTAGCPFNMAYSPASDRLAIDAEEELRVYQAGKIRSVTSLEPGFCLRPLALSPDGKRVASARDTDVLLFDADKGERITILSGDHMVTSLAYSPDGKTLAVGNNAGEAVFWPLDRSGQPTTVAFPGAPGHRWIASAIALAVWVFLYSTLRIVRCRTRIDASQDTQPSV